MTDSVFENYTPHRLSIPGASPHSGLLFQSAAMSAVEPPAPTYSPNLPAAVIDWERIEADYRANLLSVREIAAANGISHTAIQKRAKAEGWERDLAKKIKARAEAKVAKQQVATQVATEQAASKVATDRQIIEANAEVIANVRMAHRSNIWRYAGNYAVRSA